MGDFEEFVRDVIDLLTHEEQNRLYEMEMWIMNGEGVWVLDDNFIAFLGRILQDTATFSSDHRVLLLRLLAFGANQEDFSMILHMDRKLHHIMNYARDFDQLPILEQEALALLVRLEKLFFSHTTRLKMINLKGSSFALLISRYILGLGQRGRCCFCAACPNRKMYLEIRSANEGAYISVFSITEY